jgi:hypothetical protein
MIYLFQVDVGDMVFVIHEVPKPTACSKVFLMRVAAYAPAHLNFQVFTVLLLPLRELSRYF